MGSISDAAAAKVRSVLKLPEPEDGLQTTDGDHITMTVGFFVAGAVGVGWFGGRASDGAASTAGLALFAACGASAAVGAFLGLLFSLTGEEVGKGSGTQLDKVSDWLTKLLIGFGLAQASSIGRAGGDLLSSIATDIEGGGFRTVFGGSCLLFAFGGFLAAWFRIRLTLPGAMARADLEKRLADQQEQIEAQEATIADVQAEMSEFADEQPSLAEKRSDFRDQVLAGIGGEQVEGKLDSIIEHKGSKVGVAAAWRSQPLTASSVTRTRRWGKEANVDGVVILTNVAPSPVAKEAAEEDGAGPPVKIEVVPDPSSPPDVASLLGDDGF